MNKRILQILLLSCLLLMATGCGKNKQIVLSDQGNTSRSSLNRNMNEMEKNWFRIDFATKLKSGVYQDDASRNMVKKYAEIQKKCGGYQKELGTDFVYEESTVTVTRTIQCNKHHPLQIIGVYGEKGTLLQSDVKSLSNSWVYYWQKYQYAIMVGGIIFVVGILGVFLILLGIKGKRTKKWAGGSQLTLEPENLVQDLELVAVITAAIQAASEGEYPDGLKIRSIVRRR